jgi:chromosome segregation ATPase
MDHSTYYSDKSRFLQKGCGMNSNDQQLRQLQRLRAELTRLQVRQVTLQGRINSAAAMEGARSGGLGKQRRGGMDASLPSMEQERDALGRQIEATREQIAKIEARIAATPPPTEAV